MPFYLQSMSAQNGDQLQGQRQVMPFLLAGPAGTQNPNADGTGHSNPPSALPSLV